VLAAGLAAVAPAAADAQTAVAFEIGASQVGPPSGVEGESTHFGVAGLRWSHYALGGSSVSASLMFGTAFGDTTGGDFVSAVVQSGLRDHWGPRWTGGLDVELIGFEVRTPFPYRALAVEGGPSLGFQTGPLSVTAAGVLGVGRSRVELWRRFDGVHRVFEDDLWRYGGTTELLIGRGVVRAGVVGGVHETPGGTYTSGGGRIVLAGSWGAAEARTDVWETPVGTEVTGGLVFMIPLAGWSLRGFGGKSEPDPLTLAEPGSGSGGLLLSRSLYTTPVDLGGADVPYEVVGRDGPNARVRIRVEAPDGARAVALLGDFTLWEAVPMTRTGDGWSAVVDVPEGAHHYGFMVDDEWYVPDETQDVVPDEWGRESAILVIEGVT
jgi:hypothetical protein